MNDHPRQLWAFGGCGAGSLWWLWEKSLEVIHGLAPPWSVVPPLLFASAALMGALTQWADRRQARRHAEEEHRAKLFVASRGAIPAKVS